MPRPKLTVYLDVISPFAYFAFYVTKNSPIFKQCDVAYVPIFLGGVMKACGNVPPINIKNKDKWIMIEKERSAKMFNIPVAAKTPEPFPQPTINTQRALCALSMSNPSKLPDAFAALYHAFWVERVAIGKPEVFGPILAKVLGESAAKGVMEKMSSPEAKKQLTDNSDKAMADGAFGLPFFVATNSKGESDSFWGFDHLGQVADFLGLDRGEEKAFRALL